MRQSDTQQSHVASSALERLRFRSILIWVHGLLAFPSLLLYLNYLDQRWALRASALILIGAPVLLPYVVSAIHFYRLNTWQAGGPSLVRVVAFTTVLVACAAVVDGALLGVFGLVGAWALIAMLVLQGYVYVLAAKGIIDV